jgi:hypothetical protein
MYIATTYNGILLNPLVEMGLLLLLFIIYLYVTKHSSYNEIKRDVKRKYFITHASRNYMKSPFRISSIVQIPHFIVISNLLLETKQTILRTYPSSRLRRLGSSPNKYYKSGTSNISYMQLQYLGTCVQ